VSLKPRPKYITVNDIQQYTKTLVKSGILQNNGAMLPTCPLQLQEILGLVVDVNSKQSSFKIKDTKGGQILIFLTDVTRSQLGVEFGDVVVVNGGKICYSTTMEDDKDGQGQIIQQQGDSSNGLGNLAKDAELDLDLIQI